MRPLTLRLLRRLVLVLSLVGLARAASPTPDRPNILWVVSEDNSYWYVGAYGDPLARTPNLDRLAGAGLVFTKAYAPAPVCAPTRSSIISGCLASSLGTQNMRSFQPFPSDVKFFPEFLRAAGYYCTNNAKTDYNTSTPFAHVWDRNGKQAHWRGRAPGQPFFAVFNFEQSHESKLHQRAEPKTDPAKVRVPAYLPDTPTVRADLAQYYDCVSRADQALGVILKQLEDDGLADDTIVFYYSDHGGATPRSKRFLFENGTHPAMLARFPAKFRHLAPPSAQGRCDELVSFIDLAPTMLSLAGIIPAPQFQGRAFAGPHRSAAPATLPMFRNRMDEAIDFSRAVTDGRWRYVRNYLPHVPAGQHVTYLWQQASMREWSDLHRAGKLNAVQSAFFEPRGAEELYDCAADPDNVRNLAGDPAHRGELERLRAANRAHLLRVRDTGFLPEAMMNAQARGASPTTVTRDAAAYPLERILDFVDATQLGTPDAAVVVAALKDPLPVVRFWAVQALRRVTPDRSVAAELLLLDADASVRVAAADVLLSRGSHGAAGRVLSGLLAGGQPGLVRLEAVNVLARHPRLAAELLPRLTDTAEGAAKGEGGENYVGRAVDWLRKIKP